MVISIKKWLLSCIRIKNRIQDYNYLINHAIYASPNITLIKMIHYPLQRWFILMDLPRFIETQPRIYFFIYPSNILHFPDNRDAAESYRFVIKKMRSLHSKIRDRSSNKGHVLRITRRTRYRRGINTAAKKKRNAAFSNRFANWSCQSRLSGCPESLRRIHIEWKKKDFCRWRRRARNLCQRK